MIIRIVNMHFNENDIGKFEEIFSNRRSKIENFPGCKHLELWKDKAVSNSFFTYSIWHSENDLEAYRQSDLFISTWNLVKPMFSQKPKAWSLESLL